MSDKLELKDDGSMIGKTFSGDEYSGGYPHICEGEHWEHYHSRVETDFVSKGFHLGDLSWSDYYFYCDGTSDIDTGEY